METGQYTYKEGDIVARVRASNGRDWYNIRKADVGVWTCSCPAYRFKKGPVGKKSPCKHMLAAFHRWSHAVQGAADDIRVLAPAAFGQLKKVA